jgi:antirestriction protein ArdC
VLREDNRAIIRAASQASKAADYILGFLPKEGRSDAVYVLSSERTLASCS